MTRQRRENSPIFNPFLFITRYLPANIKHALRYESSLLTNYLFLPYGACSGSLRYVRGDWGILDQSQKHVSQYRLFINLSSTVLCTSVALCRPCRTTSQSNAFIDRSGLKWPQSDREVIQNVDFKPFPVPSVQVSVHICTHNLLQAHHLISILHAHPAERPSA